jgi:hypothetical protein
VALIVAVVFAVVAAAVGLFSLCCTSKGCKVSYVVIVSLVIVIEIGLVIGAFGAKRLILEEIEKLWLEAPDKQDLLKIRQGIEKAFDCCGWKEVPENVTEEQCGCTDVNVELKPCINSTEESIKNHAYAIGGGLIALAVIELAVLGAGIYLCCKKANEDVDQLQKF